MSEAQFTAKFFFDTPAVEKALDKKERKVLVSTGAHGRKVVQRSMRPGGKKGIVSQPDTPPRTHTKLLRNGILFVYSPATKSVVIGATKLNQHHEQRGYLVRGPVPGVLEEGGQLGIREKLVGQMWRSIGRRRPRPGQPVRVRRTRIKARPYLAPAQPKTTAKMREQMERVSL